MYQLICKRAIVRESRMLFKNGLLVATRSSSSGKSYTERMAETGRPVSPHVTIYSFPVVALSSIANRVTGTMLSFGLSRLVSCHQGQ